MFPRRAIFSSKCLFIEETISANEESLVADLKDDEGSIDNVPGDLEAQEKFD